MPPPADIVKVAIEWPGAFPKLMEIDQKKPLSSVIKEVCEGWSLGNHENFALQHADVTNFYITEKNRNEIKNGAILLLTSSPAQTAQQLHERIQSSSMDAKLEALKDLASSSRDITFAQEFINLDGISLLTQMVESGTDFGDMLSFMLTAFVELMDHGIVSWDTFSVAFIRKIASYVNKSAMDVAVLQRSLAILESMVLNSHDLYQKVAQEITIGQLIPHLQGVDQDIQTYTIAVINALFLKAPAEKRQNHVNPAVDFTQIPPGMLALDNMLYFAKHQQDAYIRIVLENSSREDKHECPFGRSSIELTKMLCEILKVGELPRRGRCVSVDCLPTMAEQNHGGYQLSARRGRCVSVDCLPTMAEQNHGGYQLSGNPIHGQVYLNNMVHTDVLPAIVLSVP
ncbi:UNVERIFIED_CONTAM: hypothetical protein FKN15_065036 [Acipenser sinensis]